MCWDPRKSERKNPSRSVPTPQVSEQWNLDRSLFRWSPWDAFTLRNAFESVAIFGELGAAKSTGSMAWLTLCYLLLGMGGLVCCVKPGDREYIEQLARIAGRSRSLIIVSPSEPWRCNLLRYALKKPGIVGSKVESIVSLLMTIVDAAERNDRTSSGNQKFFDSALRQLLRNGVEVCISARGDVTMPMNDAGSAGVTVTREDSRTEPLALGQAARFQVYEAGQVAIAQGDRIRITQNGFSREARRGARGEKSRSISDIKWL